MTTDLTFRDVGLALAALALFTLVLGKSEENKASGAV
jgi:hypothetical protein